MAQKVNIIIDQGTTFNTVFNLNDDSGQPIDLSTYTGASQMRQYYTANTYYAFTVNTNSNGEITLSMTANTTNNISSGRYVYDVELTDQNGNKSRAVEGVITVTPRVTRTQ